ncbi:MAG: argininosuccinate synthase, partial [Bdellovibrionales bacterium]|nr:argininosuccinate synthase [Bdellovibrionales bacterium]
MAIEKKAVVAFSGGLDTSFCVGHLLDAGYTVHTVTTDTGGFSSSELSEIKEVSKKLGAESHITVDARAEMFDRFGAYVVKAHILRGGVYPLCVGAERTVQAEHTAKLASEIGADAICHGCTGAGNDQVRFDLALRTLAPEKQIIAPIRELALSREQEAEFLQ